MNDPTAEIIRAIKQHLPPGVNLVDFFTEILPMKKEAAYRRLRGEIPLTLKEAQQVASNLHISLDKLLDLKEAGTYTSTIIRMNGNNLMDAYCKILARNIEAIRFIKTDPKAAIYAAINVLPISHIFTFPTICKFRCFKWAYQCRNTLNPLKLSEIEIPADVRYHENAYYEECQHVALNYIWMKEQFAPIINDILYFLEIGLVTKDELNILQEEFYLLLDTLEEDTSAGVSKAGAPFTVYLANTYFDSNYIYIEGNKFKASSIKVFGINYLVMEEEEICDDTKEWIESLMRFSTLISKSGEIERVHFFSQQRKMVDSSNQDKQV